MPTKDKPTKYILTPVPDPEPPSEPPRRGRPPGKRSNIDEFVQTGMYLSWDTLTEAKHKLNLRRRYRKPVREMSELCEVLVSCWLLGAIDLDEMIDTLIREKSQPVK